MLVPPELVDDFDGPDAPDASPFLAFPGIKPLAQRRTLPPIAGGASERLETDRHDWEQWLDQVDAGYPPDLEQEASGLPTADQLAAVRNALWPTARHYD